MAKQVKKSAAAKKAAKPVTKTKTPKVIAKTEKLLGMPFKSKASAKPSVDKVARKAERKANNDAIVAAMEPAELGPLSDAIGELAAKKRSKKQEADVPHIEVRLMVSGIGYPVDGSNLERTLGAGRWQRESLVDHWPDAAWVGLLTHLELPADPLDRDAASIPVKRLVQRLWYEAIKGSVPDERKAAFAERDAAAIASYKPDFDKVEQVTERRAKAGARMSAARGPATAYEPTKELKANETGAKGQAAILFAAFKTAGFKPMTTAEATAAMLKEGLKTTTKPERIAAFYLCDWSKKGWLVRT